MQRFLIAGALSLALGHAEGSAGVPESESLGGQAQEVIRAALEGRDSHLASVAVRYVQTRKKAWARAGVKKAALHPDPTLRVAALYALADLDPEEAVALFRQTLLDPTESPVVKLAAEEKLPSLDEDGSLEVFQQLLDDRDAAVRVLAAGALLELGDTSVVPVLETALRGENLDLRVDAASEFLDAGIKEHQAIAALAEVLHNKNLEPIPRSNAAYALGETRNSEAVPLLVEALKDTDRGVRLAAANSIALSRERMAPLLMEMAVTDPDYMIRLEAIHGLSTASNEKAVRALREALKDPMPAVRVAAAAALGTNGLAGDRQLIELVRSEMEARDYVVRLAALTAMGQVGDESAMAYLEPHLAERDPMTRLTTAIAIDRILGRD